MTIQQKIKMSKDPLFDAKEKIAKVVSVIFVFFIIWLFIDNEMGKMEIQNNKRYTVAITDRKEYSKSGWQLSFHYKVNNKEYKWYTSYKKGLLYPNVMYLVEFSSKSPDRCSFLGQFKVADTVSYIPSLGWDSIPMNILEK